MVAVIARKNVDTANKVVTINDNYIVEQITITAAQNLAQRAELNFLPAGPDKVTLDLIGGTSQVRDKDYYMDGKFIAWDGKALETLIDENDELRVIYAI